MVNDDAVEDRQTDKYQTIYCTPQNKKNNIGTYLLNGTTVLRYIPTINYGSMKMLQLLTQKG